MTDSTPKADGGHPMEEELVVCDNCGETTLAEDCLVYDASGEDEYYPDFHYICPGCQR